MKSGYGLEMRVAAACRSYWLPTNQSVPYVDPTQENTIREADVVVRFAGQLVGGDGWDRSRNPIIGRFSLSIGVRQPGSSDLSMGDGWIAAGVLIKG